MKAILVFFIILFAFSSSFAQEFEFVFENNTSSRIGEIYCAGNGDEWSDNLIQGYIELGQSLTIYYMPPYDICNYDFIAIGLDGTRYVFNGVDLCSTTYLPFYDLYREGNDHGDEGYYEEQENSGDEYQIDGDINDVITYNTWKITQDGYDYGTLKLNYDGSAIKTAPGGGMETYGSWSLDQSGYYLTLHFPDEGQASTAQMNYRGNEIDLMFEGESGTHQWLLTAM